MSKVIKSLTQFEFVQTLNPTNPSEPEQEWLQLTHINDIGRVDKEIRQKIIRLSPEKQLELYLMLHAKFNTGKSA